MIMEALSLVAREDAAQVVEGDAADHVDVVRRVLRGQPPTEQAHRRLEWAVERRRRLAIAARQVYPILHV